MEKNCGNCKYRTFETNNKFKTYGFCTKKGIKSAAFRVDTRREGLAVKTEDKVPKQCIPACLNVQTYYEGNCPFLIMRGIVLLRRKSNDIRRIRKTI